LQALNPDRPQEGIGQGIPTGPDLFPFVEGESLWDLVETVGVKLRDSGGMI
jgi:hypothetical protein